MENKPRNYWTKERVFEEARKYNTRFDFKKGCKRAYEVARKNEWLKEMYWFVKIRKPKNHWTKERVFEEARKYETRNKFRKGCIGAYEVALKNGWLDEMSWFISPYKPKNHWTKERVFEEARKYKTRGEFSKGCPRAYEVARRNGWLDEMTWFKELMKSANHWTKERVFEEARKYETRNKFKKGSKSAYNVARKNGWLDEMDWFVDGRIEKYTRKNDSVYRYYWEETNAIYIGRTLIYQQKIRHNAHSTDKKDTVFRYAKENGLEVPPMEIIEENITPIEGLEREDYWVKYYKEKGYNVLNIAKTGVGSGSLGAINCGKWTKEAVFKKAREYKTRSEFAKECQSAYAVALKNDWLEEMDWFKEGKKPNGYWENKERVFEKAKEYSTRKDFKKRCRKAYDTALKNRWLSEMTWFGEIRKPRNYWTEETVFEEGKKYPTRKEFRKGCQSAYNIAVKNRWLDELFPIYKKTVLQIDKLSGLVINEFPSVSEVQRQLGYNCANISQCCNGKRNTCRGFIWRYKENVA